MKMIFFPHLYNLFNSIVKSCHTKHSDLSRSVSTVNSRFYSFSHLHQLFRSRLFSFFFSSNILRLHLPPPVFAGSDYDNVLLCIYSTSLFGRDERKLLTDTRDHCLVAERVLHVLYRVGCQHTLCEKSKQAIGFLRHELYFEAVNVWQLA